MNPPSSNITDAADTTGTKPVFRRRWWQWAFSLRTMLWGVTACCVLLGLFAWRLERARQQAAAVKTVQTLLGDDTVSYVGMGFDFDSKWFPGLREWSRSPVCRDFFYDVEEVSIPSPIGRIYSTNKVCTTSSFYSALAKFSKLKELEQDPWDFEAKHLGKLTCQKTLEHLTWVGTSFDDQVVQDLSQFTKVRIVHFSQSEAGPILITNWSPLAKLPNLVDFRSSHLGIDDRGAIAVSQSKGLEQLYLNSNRIGDPGAIAFAGLIHLTELELDDNQVTSAGMKDWSNLQSLEQLSIANNPVDDAALVPFSKLPNLRYLKISGSSIRGDLFNQPEVFTALEVLEIDATQLTSNAWHGLSQLPSLNELVLTGNSTTNPILIPPQGFECLKKLRLYGPNLDNKGWEGLSKLSHLYSLEVWDGPALVSTIRAADSRSQICFLQIHNTPLSLEDCWEIVRYLKHLQILSLPSRSISDDEKAELEASLPGLKIYQW